MLRTLPQASHADFGIAPDCDRTEGPRQAAFDVDRDWADSDWQVDSTSRPCCGGIGGHRRSCKHDIEALQR
jgi:hypothetical protein